jgi:hypothetical protein
VGGVGNRRESSADEKALPVTVRRADGFGIEQASMAIRGQPRSGAG